MRAYLTESNLVKAAGLAVMVTLMSVPRLVQTGRPLGLFVVMTFLVMTLVCGAVTAWSRCAGLAGAVTARRTLMRGAAAAAAVGLGSLPIQVFWLDPLLRHALAGGANHSMAALSYPATVGGCLALILWSAGFQTIFFQAAPMSFFARLTGSRLVALGLCLALRVYVAYRQVVYSGMTDCLGLFVVSAAGTAAVGCVLFARYGLAPAMLLAAALDLHVLFTRAA